MHRLLLLVVLLGIALPVHARRTLKDDQATMTSFAFGEEATSIVMLDLTDHDPDSGCPVLAVYRGHHKVGDRVHPGDPYSNEVGGELTYAQALGATASISIGEYGHYIITPDAIWDLSNIVWRPFQGIMLTADGSRPLTLAEFDAKLRQAILAADILRHDLEAGKPDRLAAYLWPAPAQRTNDIRMDPYLSVLVTIRLTEIARPRDIFSYAMAYGAVPDDPYMESAIGFGGCFDTDDGIARLREGLKADTDSLEFRLAVTFFCGLGYRHWNNFRPAGHEKTDEPTVDGKEIIADLADALRRTRNQDTAIRALDALLSWQTAGKGHTISPRPAPLLLPLDSTALAAVLHARDQWIGSPIERNFEHAAIILGGRPALDIVCPNDLGYYDYSAPLYYSIHQLGPTTPDRPLRTPQLVATCIAGEAAGRVFSGNTTETIETDFRISPAQHTGSVLFKMPGITIHDGFDPPLPIGDYDFQVVARYRQDGAEKTWRSPVSRASVTPYLRLEAKVTPFLYAHPVASDQLAMQCQIILPAGGITLTQPPRFVATPLPGSPATVARTAHITPDIAAAWRDADDTLTGPIAHHFDPPLAPGAYQFHVEFIYTIGDTPRTHKSYTYYAIIRPPVTTAE